MRVKLIVAVLAAGAIAVGCSDTTATPTPPQSNQPKSDKETSFICKESFDKASNKKLPTTYAWTERGKIAIVRWETEVFGKRYDPKTRCEEVSPRFQTAYKNGSLNFLTNGRMNEQPVIFTAREDGGNCDTLLMTLREKDDELAILQQLGDTLKGRSTGPIRHSSGTPQVYVQVDMETFLKDAPVETD